MRNPGGYAIIVDPDAPTREWDTFTCCHCQRIVMVEAFQDPTELGGLCMMCAKLICPKCVAAGKCTPFEKQLEEMERADENRRRLGSYG